MGGFQGYRRTRKIVISLCLPCEPKWIGAADETHKQASKQPRKHKGSRTTTEKLTQSHANTHTKHIHKNAQQHTHTKETTKPHAHKEAHTHKHTPTHHTYTPHPHTNTTTTPSHTHHAHNTHTPHTLDPLLDRTKSPGLCALLVAFPAKNSLLP